MGKKTQGATSQPGDAGSNPAAVDEATAVVAAMTEPMPTGDEPGDTPAAPKKVKGLEPVPTDDETREALRNPRNDAMEAIARRRAEDLGVAPSEDEDVDPADAEAERARKALEAEGRVAPPADEPGQQEPSQTAQQLAGDVIDDPAKFKVKLKVDGQEVVVPLDSIVRTAQKDQSADRRLAEATRLLTEARERAAAAPAPAKDTPDEPAPAAPLGERIKEFVAATYSGDEDRLAKATAELLGGAQPASAAPATPAFSEEALSRVVQQELRRSEVASALSKFKSANQEIVRDPHLAMIADQFLASETQGVPLEELPSIERVNEVLNAAATKTRDWATKLGMSLAPKTPSTTRQARVERKQSIDDLPSINAAASTASERPATVQDTLNEMRKARGLPV